MKNLNLIYKKFSNEGSNSIAIFTNKSISQEEIIQELLEFHITRIDHISTILREQANSYNDVFELLAKYPDELKFCKQLFENRDDPRINLVYLFGLNSIKPIVYPLVMDQFSILHDHEYSDSIWKTFIESWCSNLDKTDLSAVIMKDLSDAIGKVIINLN